MTDPGESVAEKCIHLLVPVLEFAKNYAQKPIHLHVRESHNAIDNSPGNLFRGRTKGTKQHARAVWSQSRTNAFGVNVPGSHYVSRGSLRKGDGSNSGILHHLTLSSVNRGKRALIAFPFRAIPRQVP